MINPFTIKLSLPLISRLMELERRIFLLKEREILCDLSQEVLLLVLEEDAISTHRKVGIDALKSALEDPTPSLRKQALHENKNALTHILAPKGAEFRWSLVHLKSIYHHIKVEQTLEKSIKTWRTTPEFESDLSMPPAFMNVIFEYAPSEEISSLMEEFAQWMGRKQTHPYINPLLKIGLALPFFAIIAPFESFNARMLRFLALDLLGFYGYEFLQRSTLIQEMMSHTSCDHLYKTLKQLSAGEMEFGLWLDSWVDILQKTVNHEEKKSFEKVEITAVSKTVDPLFKFSAPISLKIQKAFERFEKLSISEISDITDINRNTLKTYLREHVREGLLLQQGSGKLSWYEVNPQYKGELK